MTTEEEKFLKRLMATFKVEADEHLKTMAGLVHTLEHADPGQAQPQLVETLFREIHSLKGAARSVNLGEAEQVCQVLESVLAKMKRGEFSPGPSFCDVCYRAIDQIAGDIDDSINGNKSGNADRRQQVIRDLEAMLTGVATVKALPQHQRSLERPEQLAATPAVSAAKPPMEQAVPRAEQMANRTVPDAEQGAETVRISTDKLGSLLLQIEELSSFKFSSQHVLDELRDARKLVGDWRHQLGKDEYAPQGKLRRRDKPGGKGSRGRAPHAGSNIDPNAVEDTDGESLVKALDDSLFELERQTAMERRQLATQLDALLQDMKQALMQPFSTLLDLMPKQVRDLAHDSRKEIDLVMHGTAIEIDRRILEQIKAPLIHLIRNAVDHGIEMPSTRLMAGKPARGRIALEIVPKAGNKIELTVSDDGAGLNLAQIQAHAAKAGILTVEALARLGREEVMDLIFESGLSTSAILTDVSGRGLGLAIVREKIEKLGGYVTVQESETSGRTGGTCFRMLLPSTLATFRGLVVEAGDRRFVLPSISVERVARIPLDSIKTVENRETIALDGVAISLVSLSDALSLGGGARPIDGIGGAGYRQVAVLAAGEKRLAFSVDAVIGDQEVLVKKLGPQLVRVPNVAGVTVLERGRLVPILNVSDLMKSALKVKGPERRATTDEPVHSILVVEDSITSRALIKGILESAGYRVSVAVDGIDGLTTLRTGRFDLVVSDVEMPRMDGFDLTAKIRSESRFQDLPVILVTALDTREHKERGIEVGANAYIVKGSFDQSNLLDAVRRLI